MKTIIKYELVINEALRSALNYNTPDEQINEFIRFFGRHIGSDRIYIFEDCKERHGTDNTYEWCGAKELNKGQKKFYKEGIKKLDDTVNGDLQDILDRFETIQSDDVMYTTFTDRSSDMDGNVKFIFESDPIEIDDEE